MGGCGAFICMLELSFSGTWKGAFETAGCCSPNDGNDAAGGGSEGVIAGFMDDSELEVGS